VFLTRNWLVINGILQVPQSSLRPALMLESGEISRVGEAVARKVDFRLVAATNRDLRVEVDEGRFRKDLYYRLAVVPVVIPPLRERSNDIPRLVEHFAAQATARYGHLRSDSGSAKRSG
jgi:sigma-54 dependent transcriptional regulator, acetoin dehydrogenase operon transcriptional activator AcoR